MAEESKSVEQPYLPGLEPDEDAPQAPGTEATPSADLPSVDPLTKQA